MSAESVVFHTRLIESGNETSILPPPLGSAMPRIKLSSSICITAPTAATPASHSDNEIAIQVCSVNLREECQVIESILQVHAIH
jgi:hypothetical protein